nr:hypothetical protein GCM10025730_19870 [Promicromonospora thailandica]
MIEIDIFTDLVDVGADGIGRVQANRSLSHVAAGALLVAGRPDGWSWVRVLEVGKQFVTFLLLSEEEAARSLASDPATPAPNGPGLVFHGSVSRSIRTSLSITARSCGSIMCSSPWTPALTTGHCSPR